MVASRRTLVLASTSAYRRALLDRLGLDYGAEAHRCDERAAEPAGASAEERARELAYRKAQSLTAAHPDAWIIGSDQVCDLDGETLHKPGTEEAACAQLARLAGRTHRLVTAVCLLGPGGTRRDHVDVHRMSMRALSPDELARYVRVERPLDCAGAYKIESLGVALFERVEGSDFTAITGLPLIALVTMLRDAGFPLP